MSIDRKTGKPIACALIKLEGQAVSYEILSEEKVTGTVAQEAKPTNKRNVCILVIILSYNKSKTRIFDLTNCKIFMI